MIPSTAQTTAVAAEISLSKKPRCPEQTQVATSGIKTDGFLSLPQSQPQPQPHATRGRGAAAPRGAGRAARGSPTKPRPAAVRGAERRPRPPARCPPGAGGGRTPAAVPELAPCAAAPATTGAPPGASGCPPPCLPRPTGRPRPPPLTCGAEVEQEAQRPEAGDRPPHGASRAEARGAGQRRATASRCPPPRQ